MEANFELAVAKRHGKGISTGRLENVPRGLERKRLHHDHGASYGHNHGALVTSQ